MTFFWPNTLKEWVEVSACQEHDKEGMERCHDRKWVTASPKNMLPSCCVSPVLDQCFRQGCWTVALTGKGQTAWCSKPVQGGRKSRDLSLGREAGRLGLCSYGLSSSCPLTTYAEMPEKPFCSFACKSTQGEEPNRHIFCIRNDIRPCSWDPVPVRDSSKLQLS